MLSLLSFLLFALIVTTVYGQKSTIPKGMSVPLLQWDMSGIELEQFREQLPLRVATLAGQLVEVKVDLSGGAVDEVEAPTAQTFTLQQLGLVLDLNEVVQPVEEMFSGSIWERARKRWTLRRAALVLPYYFDETELNKQINEHWKILQSTEPEDAVRIITAADQVTYRPEKSVIHINVAQLRDMLVNLVGEFSQNNEDTSRGHTPSHIPSITAPLQTIHPRITVESLVQQGVERKIIEFTTHFRTSGAGRVHNIQATAATIHDQLMQPGELFDFSEVVRATERNAGFKQAPVIVNGKLVPGIGGGICQVSSTLYNAVLRGGFEIVERKNHSLPVKYVPLGQDATFASGHINFKFRNHLDSYTLIRIETSNDHITVKLFSSLPDGLSYDIHSTIVKTVEPPQKFVHNPHLKKGTTKLIRKGQVGYIVDTYRTTKQNGKPIHTEKISQDHYRAQPSLIATHPQHSVQKKPDHQPSPKKQIIEDGVSGPAFNSFSF